MSIDIISLLKDRDTYIKYKKFINNKLLDNNTNTIIEAIDSYYTANPTETAINWETFDTWFKVVKYPTMNPDKLSIFTTIFKRLETHTPSSIAEQVMEKWIRQDYATRIADIALRGAEGGGRRPNKDC